jgi:hypothetical protein
MAETMVTISVAKALAAAFDKPEPGVAQVAVEPWVTYMPFARVAVKATARALLDVLEKERHSDLTIEGLDLAKEAIRNAALTSDASDKG